MAIPPVDVLEMAQGNGNLDQGSDRGETERFRKGGERERKSSNFNTSLRGDNRRTFTREGKRAGDALSVPWVA